MTAVESVEAVADTGLTGDRYGEKKGFWKVTDACAVTLISEHDLMQSKRRAPGELHERLDHGHHRRNLVIAGLKTKDLEGKRFRIGSALFAYHKPRPPCGYLDQVEGKGMCRALGRNAGICLHIIESGRLAVGDTVEIVEQATA
ncbi:MAG: MOSC domain-containing protein [Gammaproteobacteria bacterium]